MLIPPVGIYRLARVLGASRPIGMASSVTGTIVLLIALGVALGSGGGSSSSPSVQDFTSKPVTQAKPKESNGRSASELADIKRRSQDYVDAARLCLGASVTSFQIAASGDIQAASDNISKARDICLQIRSELLDKNTHGFSDQADTVWGAVDAMKSADNAALAYLDTLQPTKLSDAKRHEADANGFFAEGVREMNARRRELGIPPLKKLKFG